MLQTKVPSTGTESRKNQGTGKLGGKLRQVGKFTRAPGNLKGIGVVCCTILHKSDDGKGQSIVSD